MVLSKSIKPLRGVGLLLAGAIVLAWQPAVHAQDIVAEAKYLCDRVGGIIDEDNECIDPIIVQGDDDLIPLSDVDIPAMQRGVSPRLRLGNPLQIQEPIDTPIVQPGLSPSEDGNAINVTQQQGLQLCFNQLEYEVRACYYAFPRDIQAHNECVQAASETYEGCMRWVQSLPYEEVQN